MEFKVSKKKFLQNELLKIFIVINSLTLIYTLICFFAFDIFFGVSIIGGIFLFLVVFIYKNHNHYRDLLYIKGKKIILKKEKLYGGGIRKSKIEEEEYEAIKIEDFKENSNQFILYGNIKIKKKIIKNQLFGNFYELPEECKTVDKLIIRKNFEDEKEIRELLNCAVELHKTIDFESNEIIKDENIYYKYYRIKDKHNDNKFLFFKVAKSFNVAWYLNEKGKWETYGNLEKYFENNQEFMEEITQEEANSIQNELNKL